MAKHPFTRRDEERELTRRSLIKWSIAAGVGLGVSRSKVHEILEKHAGKDVAFAAATSNTCRTLHTNEGNGGEAMWTQIIPFFGIAQAANPAFSWAGGNNGQNGQPFAGTKYPLWNYDGNPFGHLPAERQVSAFLCGSNDTHNQFAQTSTFGLGGKGTNAFAAELQVANLTSIVPAISLGANPGPSVVPFASANNVAGAVNLFDSVASRTGGLLAVANQADLYAAHVDILSSLNRVATNPIQAGAYKTARGAAKFLGKNLAAQLQVTAADIAEFGATGASNGATRYAQALAFTVKAFSLGLTNNIHFTGYTNDPHGFWDGGDFRTEPQVFRKIIQTFMLKMAATNDPVTGEPLDRNLVWFIQGDTFKDPRNRAGWGDGTPNGTNAVFVYSSGHIHPGWHGNMPATGAAQMLGENGQLVAYNAGMSAAYAQSSIAYAVAKRQAREVQSFTGNTNYKVHVPDLEL